MSATLPQELWDAIIDCVSDNADPESQNPAPQSLLHTLALVCRAWLPRTRYHTFQDVYLGEDYRCNSDRTFRILVAHPLRTFRPAYVRTLELKFTEGSASWMIKLLSTLEPFSNVVDLSIIIRTDLDMAVASNLYLELLRLAGPCVQRLCVRWDSEAPSKMTCILGLVSGCSNLKVLKLNLGKVNILKLLIGHGSNDANTDTKSNATTAIDLDQFSKPSPALVSVSLTSCFDRNPALFDWLCPTTGPGDRVTPNLYPKLDLQLLDINSGSFPDAMQFLHKMGPNITALTICPDHFTTHNENPAYGLSPQVPISLNSVPNFQETDHGMVHPLDLGLTKDTKSNINLSLLSTICNLESISFGPLLIRRMDPDSEHTYIPDILERIRSDRLKVVTLKIATMSRLDDIEKLDWEKIIRALKRPVYAALERVVFISNPESLLPAIEAWLAVHVESQLRRGVHVRVCLSGSEEDSDLEGDY